ncbi:PREDICTED: acyl-coenzyme A amino acid N-acyltransferase 1-like [Priapulus caudatus]|uniref:Acyl-coenzyme A amino acid N-acyltransferase 1-like n=1 Tax=Priapulus caudatus TaxID=37621 RepID=A0ABM1EQV1_PRICU|nr:PREDICTED: acyl-coenzyme A amino acid N-acyltransferase 1-like [Priapulus caudatus]
MLETRLYDVPVVDSMVTRWQLTGDTLITAKLVLRVSEDELIHHTEGVSFAVHRQDFHADQLIALELAPAQILFIFSGDDKAIMGMKEAEAVTKRMLLYGKHNHEMCVYPGAGHLVEPPYSPLCKASYHATRGLHMAWGGEVQAHSFAQEDSWKRIQSFFLKHLKQPLDATP